MPLPKWIAHVNKRVFNPRELKKGQRPVLTHVGRISGGTHATPLDAHPVQGGYVFILMYGSRSDWVRNVMTSGVAELTIGGVHHDLIEPRLISKEDAIRLLPSDTKTPAAFLNVSEYLRMDVPAA